MVTPYRVVYADPPWRFGDSLPGGGRGATKHYECLNLEQLCKLQLPPIADDALMFMWRVGAMQEEALTLMHFWGFDPISEVIWLKLNKGKIVEDWQALREQDLAMGMGRYSRYCHEVCLIGKRGRAATRVVKRHNIRSVFAAERLEHSRKPDRMYEIIEEMTDGEGPYAELFARRARAGWRAMGLELGTPLTESEPNEAA